ATSPEQSPPSQPVDTRKARAKTPDASSPAVRAVMQGNRGRDTTPELRLRSALHRRGHRYRVHYPILLGDGMRVRPDIVFTRRRLVVFVDGCFWHRCPAHGTSPSANSKYWQRKLDSNTTRDAQQTRQLRGAGWRVVRIWEHTPTADAVASIETELSATRPARPAGASGP